MAAVEIEDDVRTASDDASVDGGGDARMNLRGEEESPLSKASAKDMIRHSDAEAERAALRDAADAAAALAAALGPPQVTRGGAVKPNPYEAAASEAKSKPRDSQARDALNMPPQRPKIGKNEAQNMPVLKSVRNSKAQGSQHPLPLERE